MSSGCNDPVYRDETGNNPHGNSNLHSESLHKSFSNSANQPASHVFSWLQNYNPQTQSISSPTSHQAFQNETKIPTSCAHHQQTTITSLDASSINLVSDTSSTEDNNNKLSFSIPFNHANYSHDSANETTSPSSAVKSHFESPVKFSSDISTHITGYQHFSNIYQGNHETKIIASPSGSSKTSELSRPCSNLSSGMYDNAYDSPQTSRQHSPLSYQQNRYQPYVHSPQTAPPATNFTGTFLFNDTPQDVLYYQQTYNQQNNMRNVQDTVNKDFNNNT